MGLLCGVYFKKFDSNRFLKNNGYWLTFSFILIFLLIWARPHLESYFDYKIAYTNGLLSPFFLLFIVLLASNKGILAKILSHPWLILLGEASYSLYILQKPVHGLYDKVIVPRLPLTETVHFYIFLFILITLSIFSYKFFEKPARNMIRTKLS